MEKIFTKKEIEELRLLREEAGLLQKTLDLVYDRAMKITQEDEQGFTLDYIYNKGHLSDLLNQLDSRAGQEKDVHTEHCCVVHGCKYGYDVYGEEECPVSSGNKLQSYPCEDCDWEKIN